MFNHTYMCTHLGEMLKRQVCRVTEVLGVIQFSRQVIYTVVGSNICRIHMSRQWDGFTRFGVGYRN